MTGYINKFDKDKITMSLMVKDKQLLKIWKYYNKIWKKIKILMKIDFNTKTTYGDNDDKYIKTRTPFFFQRYNPSIFTKNINNA